MFEKNKTFFISNLKIFACMIDIFLKKNADRLLIKSFQIDDDENVTRVKKQILKLQKRHENICADGYVK